MINGKISLLISIAALVMLKVDNSLATEYFVSPNGSDGNDGTISSPWATFDYAMQKLQPSDILVMKDGTFYQSLNVTVSGTSGNPITFRALNDGQVTIDGQGVRQPLYAADRTYLIFEGFVLKNASPTHDVFELQRCNNIEVRRVSAYNAGSDNNHIYVAQNCSKILYEDCVASGSGRQMYLPFRSNKITYRRCWARWQFHSGVGGPNGIIEIYGTSDCIVENMVATMDQNSDASVQGIGVWSAGSAADRNKLYGNVIYGLSAGPGFSSSSFRNINDNEFKNNVWIDNELYGFWVSAGENLIFDKNTWVGTSNQVFEIREIVVESHASDFTLSGVLSNSVIMNGKVGLKIIDTPALGSFINKYLDIYDVSTQYTGHASPGIGDISTNPNYNVSIYGKGAYLIQPTALKGMGENGGNIGAEVIYRYEDGVLTNVPLWPWPMEDRIFSETGVSVTWEAHGGLWKTLKEIYASGKDDTSPKAPVGLRVTNSEN